MLPFAVHVSLSAVHRAPLFVGFTKALGVTRSRAPNPNHPRAQKLGAFARIGIMWEHPSTKGTTSSVPRTHQLVLSRV